MDQRSSERYHRGLPCRGVPSCSVCFAPAHVGCPIPYVRQGMDADPIEWPAHKPTGEELLGEEH